MIYVTHDQVEAMTLASRIVVLHGGIIEQVGPPLVLYEEPANIFVARFIGSPAMNIFDATVTGTGEQTTVSVPGGGTAVVAVPSRGADQGASVKLGVRPEDLVPAEDGALVTGKMSIVEGLGETTLLHLETEGSSESTIAKLPGIHHVKRGEAIRLTAAPEKLHLFDGDGISFRYR
jgi:alpha-glucoside transport system ATP-binding protein